MAKFAKGKSGNPSGRPKVVVEIQDMCRALTPDVIRVLATIAFDEAGDPRGRVSASKEILDRGWGKATQKLDADIKVKGELATALEAARNRVGRRDA